MVYGLPGIPLLWSWQLQLLATSTTRLDPSVCVTNSHSACFGGKTCSYTLKSSWRLATFTDILAPSQAIGGANQPGTKQTPFDSPGRVDHVLYHVCMGTSRDKRPVPCTSMPTWAHAVPNRMDSHGTTWRPPHGHGPMCVSGGHGCTRALGRAGVPPVCKVVPPAHALMNRHGKLC